MHNVGCSCILCSWMVCFIICKFRLCIVAEALDIVWLHRFHHLSCSALWISPALSSGAGELRCGSNLLRSPAPVPSYWVSKAGEPYSYLHIQLHHHRTPGLGKFPCTDQGVDELGNSDHGDIVDFVLLLTWQLSKEKTETFLLYLEERRPPSHEPPSLCHHWSSPRTEFSCCEPQPQPWYWWPPDIHRICRPHSSSGDTQHAWDWAPNQQHRPSEHPFEKNN